MKRWGFRSLLKTVSDSAVQKSRTSLFHYLVARTEKNLDLGCVMRDCGSNSGTSSSKTILYWAGFDHWLHVWFCLCRYQSSECDAGRYSGVREQVRCHIGSVSRLAVRKMYQEQEAVVLSWEDKTQNMSSSRKAYQVSDMWTEGQLFVLHQGCIFICLFSRKITRCSHEDASPAAACC